MNFMIEPIRIIDDDIDGFIQSIVRIDTILDTFRIRFDRRDRRLQIVGNIMDHFFLYFILMGQLRLHILNGLCYFSDLIAAVDLEGGGLIRPDFIDIVLDLIQRMDQSRDPVDHE